MNLLEAMVSLGFGHPEPTIPYLVSFKKSLAGFIDILQNMVGIGFLR